MTVPVLLARGLAGGYRQEVFRDVDLDLCPGEVVGLLGPNGAGKSALVLTLCGQLRPHAGEVMLNGSSLQAMTARERALALTWLGQFPGQEGDFRVREFVELGRNPHLAGWGYARRQEDRRAIAHALAWCRLEGLEARLMRELSGGERQRARLARALAQVQGAPGAVLCLDEPTSALDLGSQWEGFTLVARVAREFGVAVLVVLHDLNLAASFCQRLALMSAGRIVMQGTPREVLTEAHLRAAYGVGVHVLAHPETGAPLLVPRTGG